MAVILNQEAAAPSPDLPVIPEAFCTHAFVSASLHFKQQLMGDHGRQLGAVKPLIDEFTPAAGAPELWLRGVWTFVW